MRRKWKQPIKCTLSWKLLLRTIQLNPTGKSGAKEKCIWAQGYPTEGVRSLGYLNCNFCQFEGCSQAPLILGYFQLAMNRRRIGCGLEKGEWRGRISGKEMQMLTIKIRPGWLLWQRLKGKLAEHPDRLLYPNTPETRAPGKSLCAISFSDSTIPGSRGEAKGREAEKEALISAKVHFQAGHHLVTSATDCLIS